MTPQDYDNWYATPRGRWIGDTEFHLARKILAPQPGETLLDVGCGTGWFSRRFAAESLHVTGLDPNPDSLVYARSKIGDIDWVEGDARSLPFADQTFDCVSSIAALCFIDNERQALAEIIRVTRRRFAIGWLNRSSLLHHQKAGQGAYQGATWHTAKEIRALFAGLAVRDLTIQSAVFLPDANCLARTVEHLMPAFLPWGSLLITSGKLHW